MTQHWSGGKSVPEDRHSRPLSLPGGFNESCLFFWPRRIYVLERKRKEGGNEKREGRKERREGVKERLFFEDGG